MNSFAGPSDVKVGSATAGLWSAGGSLSSNSHGNGWTANVGISSPGVSVSGQGSNTTLLTTKKIPVHKPDIRQQPDATGVAVPQ